MFTCTDNTLMYNRRFVQRITPADREAGLRRFGLSPAAAAAIACGALVTRRDAIALAERIGLIGGADE